MPHLTCPRCDLTVLIRDAPGALRTCPRCEGRDGLSILLFAPARHAGAGAMPPAGTSAR